jgi:hypothetical protein
MSDPGQQPHQDSGMNTPGAGLPISQNNRWDWRVIVLELVIVFVGLFAALQLDSYRDQQAFKAAQHRHLLRMSQELENYLEFTKDTQTFLRENHEAVTHVSSSLQAAEILNGDEALFQKGVIYFAHLPSNPLPRASYEEMVASGMFSALESEELKKAISGLYSMHEFVETNFEWWRDGALRFEEELASWVDYYDEAPLGDETGFLFNEPERRIRYDFEALAKERRIRNGFYWARDSVSDWYEFTERLRDHAADVDVLIKQQLEAE